MRGKIMNGHCKIGDTVTTIININRRKKIAANHSATHLLHEALRRILGDSVTQKGSLVTDERLRFDFSYTKPITLKERQAIELYVNTVIQNNQSVITEILTPDIARQKGALALFGEKYSDKVRVLFMGNHENDAVNKAFSIELCGGTHVESLGNIGCFVIESESSIASGIRRIEALTGQACLDYLNQKREITEQLSATLKTSDIHLINRIDALLVDKKSLEKEISHLKQKSATNTQQETINNVQFISQIVKDFNTKELMTLIDTEKQKIGSGIITYININDDKVGVAVGVTKDLTDRYNAVDFVKAASQILGGKGGGGRADFAQAGGHDKTKIDNVLHIIKEMIISN
jgi:alanyl-tRNA synthetase